MTKASFNQTGASHIVAVLAVVVLGVVGFAGFKVLSMNEAATSGSINLEASAPKVPAAVKTSADLTQTTQVLDSADTQLDSTLNDTALDADLNDML